MEHLKYPVGKFSFPENIDPIQRSKFKNSINEFPLKLNELLHDMDPQMLEKQYRPDGWTGRQVIHHLADSHSHALIRFKWSLTEVDPTIKPYLEAKNAILADYSQPVESALFIIQGVHIKWQNIMESMSDEDWARGYIHPETKRYFRLDTAAAMYDWHGRHHLAHIALCKEPSI